MRGVEQDGGRRFADFLDPCAADAMFDRVDPANAVG